MEEPFIFKNKSNQTLFAILHTPEKEMNGDKRIGVNILNPGLKNRVAPNRLNVKIARMLCDKGFYVFRFDPHGIGDSEGQLSENNAHLLEMWGMIQKGAFVNDTIISNDIFIEKFDLDKILLIGQCGAGVTALLCGGLDRRVDKLLLIDAPFRVVGSDMNLQDILSEYNQSEGFLKKGIQTIRSPQKIKKLITHDFNWRFHLNTFSDSVQGLFKKNNPGATFEINDRFNWQMLEAFEKYINRKGKIYFIYAENDFSLKEFNQDFKPNFLDQKADWHSQCKIDIIKNANHIYTENSWQSELFDNILGWIEP